MSNRRSASKFVVRHSAVNKAASIFFHMKILSLLSVAVRPLREAGNRKAGFAGGYLLKHRSSWGSASAMSFDKLPERDTAGERTSEQWRFPELLWFACLRTEKPLSAKFGVEACYIGLLYYQAWHAKSCGQCGCEICVQAQGKGCPEKLDS
jgi:hypothetical protein